MHPAQFTYPAPELDYERMDIESLRRAYTREMDQFKTSLLNGTPWEEIQQCRLNVSSLSVALHNRLSTANRPRAGHTRRTK
ncbi:hypothetical protein [Flaviaesturariibacter aridisoli]|uniref:Uncharacterized protein n=1 Tax=Flaviaesturariibacter aridisoli TaxID=2545761 RepID=A0A4R4DW47_9BACT|nr:hypothetical protein [Flaviaesturariibacter aridisoli]TCZ67905.1 hypothetical protein E0486_14855 [Flaviaesturariibacter aridisoli]